MESESNSNTEKNNVQDKQQHIKQRLKDLGVSDDSKRPEKSWFGKYGNYLMISIIAVLVAAYWVEHQDQNNDSVQQTIQVETPIEPIQSLNPHFPSSSPDHRMQAGNQQHTFMRHNAMQQRMMQQRTWEQQMRQQAWQNQMREQQVRNRHAWEQWQKQQQAQATNAGSASDSVQGQINTRNQPGSFPYAAPYPQYYPMPQPQVYPQPYYNGWRGY